MGKQPLDVHEWTVSRRIGGNALQPVWRADNPANLHTVADARQAFIAANGNAESGDYVIQHLRAEVGDVVSEPTIQIVRFTLQHQAPVIV